MNFEQIQLFYLYHGNVLFKEKSILGDLYIFNIFQH